MRRSRFSEEQIISVHPQCELVYALSRSIFPRADGRGVGEFERANVA